MRLVIPIAAFALSLTLLSACITYDPIPSAEIGARIHPGDRVLVETREGVELTFRVTEVDSGAAALVGKDQRVGFAEIAKIERRRLSWGRTAAAMGGGALILLGALVLTIFAAYAA